MASLAPFTKIAQMGPPTPTYIRLIYSLLWHLDPAPLFQPICHSSCIRFIIQIRSTETIARFASLMIHCCIVLVPLIHLDPDSDFLAGPSVRLACLVEAFEVAHDVPIFLVFGFGAGLGIMEL